MYWWKGRREVQNDAYRHRITNAGGCQRAADDYDASGIAVGHEVSAPFGLGGEQRGRSPINFMLRYISIGCGRRFGLVRWRGNKETQVLGLILDWLVYNSMDGSGNCPYIVWCAPAAH